MYDSKCQTHSKPSLIGVLTFGDIKNNQTVQQPSSNDAFCCECAQICEGTRKVEGAAEDTEASKKSVKLKIQRADHVIQRLRID